MDREGIRQVLPHREPMLLLDTVVNENGVARGTYRIRGDEWFLQGHFPGSPVVPGVILCEILAQSVCLSFEGEDPERVTPFITGMNRTRFLGMVRPGDLFETECRLKEEKKPFYFFQGQGKVGDRICIKTDFSIALLDKEQANALLGIQVHPQTDPTA